MDQAGRPASDNAITSTLHSLAPVLRRYHHSSTKQTVSGHNKAALRRGKNPSSAQSNCWQQEGAPLKIEEHVIILFPPRGPVLLLVLKWQKCRVVSEMKKQALH